MDIRDVTDLTRTEEYGGILYSFQGHVSNSAIEASPTQDLLHGTVSHITFEK